MKSVASIWREKYLWVSHRRFKLLEQTSMVGMHVKYNTSHAAIFFLTFLLRRATTTDPVVCHWFSSWFPYTMDRGSKKENCNRDAGRCWCCVWITGTLFGWSASLYWNRRQLRYCCSMLLILVVYASFVDDVCRLMRPILCGDCFLLILVGTGFWP